MIRSFPKPSACIVALIRFYQIAISPFFPTSCRFMPTCSTYASLAVTKYGIIRGGFLAAKRILRCHPFNPGGYDPLR
jgi:putative membrane protein insertion efficiency factor